jgi:hypothetical protein
VTGRLNVALFGALCAVGVVSSVGLTVREVLKTAPVVASVAHTDRSGLTTTVEVAVRNTTDSTRCATVEVAARDRTGHDLGPPVTVATGLQLAPHGRQRVPARVTLTARDYAERLDRFYPSVEACAAPERGS